jgi:hypothetical protein
MEIAFVLNAVLATAALQIAESYSGAAAYRAFRATVAASLRRSDDSVWQSSIG